MVIKRMKFKRNWLYMLTGLLISVFLWLAVSADTVAQQTLLAELVVVNADRRFVMTEQEPATREVSVVFTGRAGDLALLSISRPQIVVAIDSVNAPTREVVLEPSLVRGRGGRDLGDVRAVSVRPERLTLRFERRATKVVPVVPLLQVQPGEGYVFADSPRAEPSAVAVEGPEASVALIDSVFTVPVREENVRQSRDIEAPLEQPSDSLVVFSSERVRIAVAIEQRTERVFPGIPVGIGGGATDGLRVEPSLVDVRISGPRSRVEAVRPEDLSPEVTVRGRDELDRLLPIRLSGLDPFLTAVFEPDSARAVRSENAQ
jgi:YbbR domain-containing protein